MMFRVLDALHFVLICATNWTYAIKNFGNPDELLYLIAYVLQLSLYPFETYGALNRRAGCVRHIFLLVTVVLIKLYTRLYQS